MDLNLQPSIDVGRLMLHEKLKINFKSVAGSGGLDTTIML